MNIKDFSEKLFEYAKGVGFSDCEVYYVKADAFGVKVLNKDLNQFSNAKNDGLSFRGLLNGKMGYAFTEQIDDSVIEALVENAKLNAELIENEDVVTIYAGANSYEKVDAVSKLLNGITTDEKLKAAFDMESYAYSLSDKVFKVNYCTLNTSDSETQIINTKGLDVKHKMNNAVALLGVIVKDGNSTKTFHDFWYGNDIENFNYEEMCEYTVGEALKRLNASSVKSGKYDILLEKSAMISLLETFWTVFSAKTVQDNLSKMKGKLGEKVSSSKITIVDDGMLKEGKVPVPFDSEGYKTQRTVLVDSGVLKSYLHSSKTALKDGVESTGNGFKASYKSSVAVQPTNFYLEKGTVTFDEMQKSLGTGLIIDSLSGLHAGVNSVSGDFSLLASGFLVEGGEVTKAVEQITIAGNFFDLLNEVEEIGSDMKYDLGGGLTVGSPSVLVRGMNISGE